MAARSTRQWTTEHFRNALIRRIDEIKPDPSIKTQLMNLHLNWDQHPIDVAFLHDSPAPHSISVDPDDPFLSGMCGTLTLTSDYISVLLHITSWWRIRGHVWKNDCNGDTIVETYRTPTPNQNDATVNYSDEENRNRYLNIFYFKIEASAALLQSLPSSEPIGTIQRKLRSNMTKRLRSDPAIRQLLNTHEPLCEASIRMSHPGECEERVNANSTCVEAIQRAVMGRCEEPLEVLEFVLNLPYLPLSRFLRETENAGVSLQANHEESALIDLAERAYLRILEDAMFDACEKEGEDDLLDDLNLSDCANRNNGADEYDAGDAISLRKKGKWNE